ncbi:hypothetical protein DdX_13735 [Ditylenchus destructor]|uniref:Uncharacterized protein n=1 Tax=Ditylenchus destructor TaxID=166010 RepID=A0AAD4QZA2_9BILA|nr:hypothetical protein DdX_13735 [Ditylenchus destructor]
MSEPLQFFKVDHTTIYQDGFSYSFYRDLDPPKSSADLQLRQSFHCAFGTEEQKCPSRCHVTGDWLMDKKGSKFMLGIVKKADHTHGPEYRDTIPKFRFYTNNYGNLHRNGFVYSLYRKLDSPKLIADLEWHQTYRCSMSDQENCRARIYTSGLLEKNKHGDKFQWGTFKNCNHNHGSDQNLNEESKEIVSPVISPLIMDIDTIPKFLFYKNNDGSLHENGFDYSFYRELDPPKQIADFQWHEAYRCSMRDQKNCPAKIYTTGYWQKNINEVLRYQLGIFKNCYHSHGSDQDSKEEKIQIDIEVRSASSSRSRISAAELDKKERIRFYKFKDENGVQHAGFVYSKHRHERRTAENFPIRWRCRTNTDPMIHPGPIHTCKSYIRTTGKWEEDDRGREFQIGIVMAQHDHEPHQISFQGKDNDDEVPEVGQKFYQFKEKAVHRDGYVYRIDKQLTMDPHFHVRMLCSRARESFPCTGYIWTTGEWEQDKLRRRYQRGILKGGHSHEAYEQLLNEDDATHFGGPMEYEVTMTEPLKFFKVDHTTIYQDGFSYSFYRDLDPPKSSADLQLHQSFHCALRSAQEQKCPSRCHVTGDWLL